MQRLQFNAEDLAYHKRAVEPYWDRIRHHVDTERAHRARIMAAGGVDALLATLHPRVRWRPPFLDVGDTANHAGTGRYSRPAAPASPRPIVLSGRSLVLFPTIFDLDGPHIIRSAADETMPVVLLYPALRQPSDALALWTPPTAPTHRALAMLLGATRARALEAIADTCTTTELAQRIDVSPPTASHHVGVLRAASLVTSHRTGNAVVHRITPTGATLLHGHPPPAPAPPTSDTT